MDYELTTGEVSKNDSNAPMTPNTRIPSEAIDMSNPWVLFSSFSGSLQHPSIDLDTVLGQKPEAVNLEPIVTPPYTSVYTSTTSGHSSLLEPLASLEQHSDSIARLYSNTDPLLDSGILPSSWPPSSTEVEDRNTASDNEDSEDVVGTICRVPALDKTAEGNALPFVLQSYAMWVHRMVFEPLKMVRIARDFVFGQFSGGEESRWVITLLANVGSRIANLEILDGKYDPVLSALQDSVRRRLKTVRSVPRPSISELTKALNAALETMMINFFVSPLSDVVTLREEAAPIFQQLCPTLADASISLPQLLAHPLFCLRQYAHVDILFSVVMDMPMLFRYNTAIPDGEVPSSYGSRLDDSGGSGVQWLQGVPDQLILLFAKLKSIRDDGLKPSSEIIECYEHEIRDHQSFKSSSPDSLLVIMRFAVQECWRHVAYIYLYMAICGDSADTPRVKEVVKRFLKILHGIKPGRLPDEFLIMNLILVAPAARRQRDREAIRQRIKGLHMRGRTFRTNHNVVHIIEDYWARADNEKREVVWSDITISRKRIMGS
ncbi:unnamed protein product [Rhizoctonia solani]|uniref:Fungal-specific transcription factor domain protein n=1 Tax=Rhizoctonia solani TaxID=456999 RepID=A0A8H3BGI9_9AGAM|nr:unnamed protein product [Rhizoctonia solani]